MLKLLSNSYAREYENLKYTYFFRIKMREGKYGQIQVKGYI